MQKRTQQVLGTAVAACALFALSRSAAAAAISYAGGDYLQNFDTLSSLQSILTYPSPGPNDVPTGAGGVLEGWSFGRFSGTNTTIEWRVRDGNSTSLGHAGSYGVLDAPDRALGTVATTASVPAIGFQMTNNTGGVLNQFTLSFTGEQWRRGTQVATGALNFAYSNNATNILTGTFIPVSGLNFVGPNNTTPTAVPLDGNADGNRTFVSFVVSGFVWNAGEVMTFRWNDLNEDNSDDWLAIDDLTFNARKAPVLKWNTANTSGAWDQNPGNTPWLDETPAPAKFTNNDVVSLGPTSSDIDITVDSAGVISGAIGVTNTTNKYTLSGGSVSGPLNKSGAGTLVLKSPNSFTNVTISEGTVETQTVGALGSVNINLSNGGTWKITTANQLIIANNNTVNITGSGTIFTETDLDFFHSVQGANVIFTKDGPGLFWARHNTPLTGNSEIHVNAGTMRDSDDIANFGDGIPDSVVLRIAAGATFDETFGNGEQFSALAGDGTYLGHRVANGSGHISLLNNTNTVFTFNGLITAGTAGVAGTTPDEREILAFRKQGIHTAVLTNPNNDFAGQMQVTNGVLEIPQIANRGEKSTIGMGNIASNPATPGADITFGSQGLATETAGILRYTGPSASSDRLINLNAGSGAIEVTNASTRLTLTGAIGGAANVPFQKTGPGTLVLTSDNNGFSGGMDVVAGKLLINNPVGNGAGTGLLSVKNGATLGGTGTMATTVSIQSGGTLAPGEGIGALIGFATSLDDGAKMLWELNSNDGSSDSYIINGNLDLLGAVTLDLVDLGTPAPKTFTLVNYTGTLSNFSNLAIGSTPSAQLTYTLVDNTGNMSIDLVVTPGAVQPQWNVDADGSWSAAANWQGGIPNGATATANFLGKITAPRTVTLDGDKTVNTINFDNANKYTIAPGTGGTLAVTSAIHVISGTHEISAPLSLGGNVTKDGVGTLIISGSQSHATGAALNVARGQVQLNSNAGTSASAGSAAVAKLAVNVSEGAVVLGADQTLAGLTLQTALAGNQGLDLRSPAAAGAFRSVRVYAADLGAAKTSLYSAIKSSVTNNGDGIFDSTLHANAKIGIAQVADAHGDQHILIRPTRVGDLNLDGVVTISDFIDLASNFNSANKTWQEGDLNYDGVVTISDFIDLASNFNSAYSGETFPISDADAATLADFAAAHGVSVPEPSTFVAAALAAIAMTGRRRRR